MSDEAMTMQSLGKRRLLQERNLRHPLKQMGIEGYTFQDLFIKHLVGLPMLSNQGHAAQLAIPTAS